MVDGSLEQRPTGNNYVIARLLQFKVERLKIENKQEYLIMTDLS